MSCKKRDKNELGQLVACTQECKEWISRSEKNPGRPYWCCPDHGFSHWIDTPVPTGDASATQSAAAVGDHSTYTASQQTSHIQQLTPFEDTGGSQSTQNGSPSSQNTTVPLSSNTPLYFNPLECKEDLSDTEDEETATVLRDFSLAISNASDVMNKALLENAQLKREHDKLKGEAETPGGVAVSREIAGLKEEKTSLKQEIRDLMKTLLIRIDQDE
ncbi:hypothetical protein HDU98_005765 [Podochytrium sp. JEL0797]|nr:hypothetical protein HDU98_005765 [Podochytrium sp. JEL0797]